MFYNEFKKKTGLPSLVLHKTLWSAAPDPVLFISSFALPFGRATEDKPPSYAERIPNVPAWFVTSTLRSVRGLERSFAMRNLRMLFALLALSLVVLWGGVEKVQASWDPSGYQLAIQTEAFHALSTRNNGTSGVTLYVGSNAYAGGDWDYVNDPGGASALSAMKSHYSASQIGSYGFWREDWITRACVNVGHGGYCKFFADLVQWRATGGAKGFLPCNTCTGGSVSNVGVGDIIQIPSNTAGHTAVVVGILARNNDGSVKTVDVIDSNYVGGDGKFIIAHHPISQPELNSYRTYH